MAGIRITLKETGQQSIARLWVAGVTSKIIKGYWVNSKGEKITLHPYDEPDFLYFYFESIEESIGKKVVYELFDSDLGIANDDSLYKGEYIISETNNTIIIPLTPELFQKGKDNITEFLTMERKDNILKIYIKFKVEDDRSYEFPTNDSDYLKIHVIEFVPKVMRKLSWTYGEELQNIWFRGYPNKKPWKEVILGVIKMDWVLSFPRVKKVYDNLVNNLWKEEKAINILKKMIKRMTQDNNIGLKLPKENWQTVSFGVTSDRLIEYENVEQPKDNYKQHTEKMPLFERFYYTSTNYKITDLFKLNLSEPLDDLTATLGSFNFRVIALGIITKTTEGFLIKINKIGVYIEDSFDFITKDEGLGDWNITKNKVQPIYPLVEPPFGSYRITNESYQKYRKDYGKGMDFNVYSDIKYIDKTKDNIFYATEKELS
ncbi:DUF6402 family protein [Capnocytophaga catalasegens]|uniref:Uncharacterized protein n=1 Tax=Capnocytophaga catalasegens TaxID=1004260 RepID=A0AAV5B127_9FLAO|nr:DUF6402 family protein [Capnocytophaga catalasegens]GIZ14368.1 hypothetical protein RCZ03_03690 [Capnocytophaga catalasegens]GJM51633.1 hypothetical protein RCZ15_26060 [Capnocytophaga catalasegens]GJM54198.1 hypothetical protein RCZ16_25140 [Capnocytophaga catalasegens]